MFYGLARDHDWFKHHCSLFVGLCPVVNPGKDSSTFANIMSKKSKQIEKFNNFFGINEVPRYAYGFSKFLAIINHICPPLMKSGLRNFSDTHPDLVDPIAYQRYIYNFPAGTSTKNLRLWEQIYNSSNLVTYNYGEENNYKK